MSSAEVIPKFVSDEFHVEVDCRIITLVDDQHDIGRVGDGNGGGESDGRLEHDRLVHEPAPRKHALKRFKKIYRISFFFLKFNFVLFTLKETRFEKEGLYVEFGLKDSMGIIGCLICRVALRMWLTWAKSRSSFHLASNAMSTYRSRFQCST